MSSEGNPVSVGLLSSENIGAILMLPQLESILQHVVEDQRSSTQSSHGVSSLTCSSKLSVSGSIAPGLCDDAAIAVRQLLAMVRYSRHVRLAILSANCASDISSETDRTVPMQILVANYFCYCF